MSEALERFLYVMQGNSRILLVPSRLAEARSQ